MKSIKVIFILTIIFICHSAKSQEMPTLPGSYWQIGIGLGELPMDGSFKPSLTFGYYFNDHLYTGIIYQFKDQISRDGSSFNAKSSGLEGLADASEVVGHRFLWQIRYTPFLNGPYLSTGLVFNGRDTETMQFDARSRTIAGETHTQAIEIKQTRPAGWGAAIGLGYQYNFRNGFAAGFEWTPAWGQYPKPTYSFSSGSNLSKTAKATLQEKMDEGFRSSVTNMYKVFHIGIAYRIR